MGFSGQIHHWNPQIEIFSIMYVTYSKFPLFQSQLVYGVPFDMAPKYGDLNQFELTYSTLLRLPSWWPLHVSKDVVKPVTSHLQMFSTVGGGLFLP